MNKVCGLIFSPDFAEVVLTQNAGVLSGIDGVKNHPKERGHKTMSRCCKEITGLEIKPEEWTLFAEFMKVTPDKTDREWTLYFFHATHRYKDANCEGGAFYSTRLAVGLSYLHPHLRQLIPIAICWEELNLDIVGFIDKSARSRRKQ